MHPLKNAPSMHPKCTLPSCKVRNVKLYHNEHLDFYLRLDFDTIA